jgi:hypothetical protein
VSHWNVDDPEIQISILFCKIKIRGESSSRKDFKFCNFFWNFFEFERGGREKQAPGVRFQGSGAGKAGVRGQVSGVRSGKTGVRCRVSGVRGGKTGLGGRVSAAMVGK